MSRRAVILFVALGIAWGIPYLLIKIAVTELDPALVAFGRNAIGGVLLLPLALARKQVLPVLRHWRPLLAYSAAEVILPGYFLNSAEQRLPSSTTGLLLAAVPIVGVGVAFVLGRPPRLTAVNWLGILAGMLGVAALVGLDIGGSDLFGVAQLGLVVLGYATGPAILSRWMADLSGLGVVACSLALSAIAFVPLVFVTGGWPSEVPSPPALLSVIVLGAICSAAALLIMFALVAAIGPVRMTTVTYVNPAVAIAAGAIVLHERVTGWTVLGFALVIAGSVLVTRHRVATPPEPDAAPVSARDVGRAPPDA